MLTFQTQLHVHRLTSRQVFDFLINPTDERYQQWWPGTHLHFHTLPQRPGNFANRVFMDEFVGRRRVRMQGVVVEAVPGSRLVWQFRRAVPLPVWLALDLTDDATGLRITHTLQAGFDGPGVLLDPLLRLYFSRSFAQALDEHVREEFTRLALVLGSRPVAPLASTALAAT